MPVQTVIKFRRDTAANWTSTNPTLASGEPGLETDTGKIKYGDGSTAWTSLAYETADSAYNLYADVKNSSGSSITKGTPVYVSSANGTNMLISVSTNATEAGSSKTLGLLTTTLANNGIGRVTTQGLLAGLNTSAATIGDSVWLGVNGALLYGTANKPVAPAHMVFIGIVTRVSSTNGEIFVRVQNGFELDELHDVLITSKTNGDLLQYESSTGLWKNKAQSTLTIAESQVTNLVSDLAGKAAASHTHAQSDITNLATDLAAKANLSGAAFTGAITGNLRSTISDKSANYSTLAADAGKTIRSTGSAITITIDNNLSAGDRIDFIQYGSGQITFAAGTGVTLNSVAGKLKTTGQYSGATVQCVASGVYVLIGDIAA
jgi:hypothetical protein